MEAPCNGELRNQEETIIIGIIAPFPTSSSEAVWQSMNVLSV
jgi:hypothetical protein